MSAVCIYCSGPIKFPGKGNRCITHDICPECIDNIFDRQDDLLISFIANIEAPILLLQPEPGQVRTANKKACELFEKDLSQIERHRNGQVFDCIHAFTEAGCGTGINCEGCKIRNSVMETFTSGKSFNGISAVLDIKKDSMIRPYNLQIATEKVGDLALMRIDKYERLD